jgi:large subunit ribosomal protein L25
MASMGEMTIKATVREGTGKGVARKLRRKGMVPAIVYGREFMNVAIAVPVRDIRNALAHEAKLVKLEIDGSDRKAPVQTIIKEVQVSPVTGEFLHVDFQQVRMDEVVSAFVPVVIVNEHDCEGIRAGGVLQHTIRELEVEALPKDLPPHIEVDILTCTIGDSIKVADLALPEGVKVLAPEDEVILSILPPKIVVEEVTPAAEEEVEVPTVSETEKKEEE